ncbi:hypothetical protein FA15DRAFT_83833 [Coprinopsis marcescibilis]|uniref:Uncharacterized protein n=1 Tax=Coprinopsis marcescibilis TaxID=230819 RepID=A0A5C3KMK2_COPMA|nr:hypothetical protein FA15DRAFT_83833 [Coprinopsis marcescibilis]
MASGILRAGVLAAVLLFSQWVQLVQGAPVTRTIDDTHGDRDTGFIPIYNPAGGWNGPGCPPDRCDLRPDGAQAHLQTFQETTYLPEVGARTITLEFTGTEVTVYFVLAETNAVGTLTETNVDFIMDGTKAGEVRHRASPLRTGFSYRQQVFRVTGLPNRAHTLDMVTVGARPSWISFDYAEYIFDDGEPADGPETTPDPPPPVPVPSSTPRSNDPPPQSNTDNEPTGSPNVPNGPTGPSNPAPSITPASAGPSGNAPQGTGNQGGDGTTDVFGAFVTPIPGNNTSPGTSGAASRTSSPPVGAIVGAILGVLALIAIVILLLLWRRKRRLEANKRFSQMSEFPDAQQQQQQPVGHSRTTSAFTSLSAFTSISPFRPTSPESGAPYGGTAPSVMTGTTNATSVAPRYYEKGRVNTMQHVPNVSGSEVFSPTSTARTSMLTPHQEALRRERQSVLERQLKAIEQELQSMNSGSRVAESDERSVASGDSTMAEIREQMRLMQGQIAMIRYNQTSDWAAGLTDELPPGYTPAPAIATVPQSANGPSTPRLKS